jgi:hypothetical protein
MDDDKTSNLHDKVKKKRFCRACNSRHSDNQIESDSDPHMLVELSGLKTRGDKAVNCRSQQIFLQSYLLLARLLPLQHIFLPTFQEPPLLHTSQSPTPRLAPITNLTGKLPPSDPALVYLPVLNWSKAFTVSYLSIIANPLPNDTTHFIGRFTKRLINAQSSVYTHNNNNIWRWQNHPLPAIDSLE